MHLRTYKINYFKGAENMKMKKYIYKCKDCHGIPCKLSVKNDCNDKPTVCPYGEKKVKWKFIKVVGE